MYTTLIKQNLGVSEQKDFQLYEFRNTFKGSSFMSIFSKVMYISYYRFSQWRRFYSNITEVILCWQDDVPGKHIVTNHKLVAYRIAIALSCRLKKNEAMEWSMSTHYKILLHIMPLAKILDEFCYFEVFRHCFFSVLKLLHQGKSFKVISDMKF